MTRSKLLLVTGIVGILFIIDGVWLTSGWGGPWTQHAVADIGSMFADSFVIASAAWVASKSRGRQRLAWSLLSFGAICCLFGDAVAVWFELWLDVGMVSVPFAGDAGYLLWGVATCLALVLLPIGNAGQSATRLLLDGLIVAGSLFVIFWAAGLDEVFRTPTESRLAFIVTVAYPIEDLILLTVSVVLLTRARRGQRAMLTVFALATFLLTLADVGFVAWNADGTYTTGSVLSLGWLGGLILLGFAALVGSRAKDIEYGLAGAPSRTALWLPYVPLPLAVVCIAMSDPSMPMVVAAVLLVTAVLARQFIVANENRTLLATVAEQAFRDPLTGLANRALFQDRLAHAVARRITDARNVAVLLIDLDDFKLVNDSLGHPAGDAVLMAAAERLLECVRSGDTVARIGGDEFAILLEGGTEAPLTVAQRVFDAFDEPFDVDGRQLFMRPSVGVSSGTTGAEEGDPAETLFEQADLAMYAAKRSQHGGVRAFANDMRLVDSREIDTPHDGLTTRRHRASGLQLFAELRRAIDQDELSVVYQPQFSLATGDVARVEALVRWQHPERGLLLPAEFLPMARQNGLMGALTEAVIHRAARDAAGWRAKGVVMPLAVNLFPPSLADLELPQRIVRILEEGKLGADCLTVEITEDFLLADLTRVRQVLNMLREARIRVAIDDFGSGYSALSYLSELPIDELKLDGHLIAPILDDPRADAVVVAMIDLTRTLGMTSVAEGVENAATAARLAEHGCDEIQGYYCGPPVEASGVLDVGPLLPAGSVAR